MSLWLVHNVTACFCRTLCETCSNDCEERMEGMKRRTFIKDTSAFALSLSVFGRIQWNGQRFEGNNPTTTDILGPYYRPGAPFRSNINPPDFEGRSLHLSGTIYRNDGLTPNKDCFIEIWQCNSGGEYDNVS